jgi:hypothetical protein
LVGNDQALVSAGTFVVAGGEGERFDVPGQEVLDTGHAGVENCTVPQPVQVRMPTVVGPQLAD